MATFTLEIELGNEAMQFGEDIAGALHEVAYYVEQHDDPSGAIYDLNGNRVGNWKYAE